MKGSGGVGSEASRMLSYWSCWGSWAVEASPPPKGEGWTPGQATFCRNSSTLITGHCWTISYKLFMIMSWPWCRLCSIDKESSELWAEGPRRTGASGGEGQAKVDGADVQGAGAGVADVDGPSDLLALDFWVPWKVTEGSSRFQQFFLI